MSHEISLIEGEYDTYIYVDGELVVSSDSLEEVLYAVLNAVGSDVSFSSQELDFDIENLIYEEYPDGLPTQFSDLEKFLEGDTEEEWD